MKFKIWLEEDEEWSPEEIHQHVQSVHASDLIRPFNPPEYCDPDDFYQSGGGGVFTFTYSQREIVNPQTKQPEPEGLRVDSWAATHREMARKNYSRSNLSILCGRYGVEHGTPIVAIWNLDKRYLLLACLKDLLGKQLILPDAYVFGPQGNEGTVAQILKIRSAPKKNNVEMVQIGNREYSLYSIPALLHSLPSGSQEHKEISSFICQDEKHPYLKQFRSRAGCSSFRGTSKHTVPDFLNRRNYWNTSECYNLMPDTNPNWDSNDSKAISPKMI